jgi:mannose-6-phosphate isomerase-like protein (cupin superfamily)
MEKVNLAERFATVNGYFQQQIVGELNGQYVKLAKVKGEFVWHHHENEDEMFLIVKGELTIRLRDGDVTLHEGEFFIIPRGVEHCPVSKDETHIMLFEPTSTVNTGNVRNELTHESVRV